MHIISAFPQVSLCIDRREIFTMYVHNYHVFNKRPYCIYTDVMFVLLNERACTSSFRYVVETQTIQVSDPLPELGFLIL